jgi:hypothetical protein
MSSILEVAKKTYLFGVTFIDKVHNLPCVVSSEEFIEYTNPYSIYVRVEPRKNIPNMPACVYSKGEYAKVTGSKFRINASKYAEDIMKILSLEELVLERESDLVEKYIRLKVKDRYPVGSEFESAHLPGRICKINEENHKSIILNWDNGHTLSQVLFSYGNKAKNGHDYSEMLYTERVQRWAKVIEPKVEPSPSNNSTIGVCQICGGTGQTIEAKLYPSGHSEIDVECYACEGTGEVDVEEIFKKGDIVVFDPEVAKTCNGYSLGCWDIPYLIKVTSTDYISSESRLHFYNELPKKTGNCSSIAKAFRHATQVEKLGYLRGVRNIEDIHDIPIGTVKSGAPSFTWDVGSKIPPVDPAILKDCEYRVYPLTASKAYTIKIGQNRIPLNAVKNRNL